MQLDDLLRLLRTRWYVIAAVTATFVVLAWVLVPGRLSSEEKARFRATATLVSTSGSGTATTTRGQSNQFATYAVVAVQGRVPAAVAQQLGVDIAELLSQVEVTPSTQTSSLSIVATDRSAVTATRIADLLAAELVRTLGDQVSQQREATRGSLAAQVDQLAAESARLAVQAKADSAAKDALDATNRQLNTQRTRLAEFEGAEPGLPLRTLGPASARRLDQANTADKLVALPVRTLLALLLGLAGSIGVLILADRFDVRLHTKEAVEVAFGLPVLAEVPVLPRRLRRTMVVADAPETAFAEAHRILRTSVEVARLALGREEEHVAERPRLIVVTSADPNEGKTTTAVNLAASFAEAGRSTLLVGADLRHSDIDEIVGRPLRAQLVSLGASPSDPRPVQVSVTPTSLGHLRLLTIAPPVGRPPVVLPVLAQWLASLHDEVDTIIVDTPPLLVCNDASELLPVADAVLIVCRIGDTTADAAARCSEVLARLRAKVIGVVMVGAALRAPVRRVYGYGYSGAVLPPHRESPADEGEPDVGFSNPDLDAPPFEAPLRAPVAPTLPAAPTSGFRSPDEPTDADSNLEGEPQPPATGNGSGRRPTNASPAEPGTTSASPAPTRGESSGRASLPPKRPGSKGKKSHRRLRRPSR